MCVRTRRYPGSRQISRRFSPKTQPVGEKQVKQKYEIHRGIYTVFKEKERCGYVLRSMIKMEHVATLRKTAFVVLYRYIVCGGRISVKLSTLQSPVLLSSDKQQIIYSGFHKLRKNVHIECSQTYDGSAPIRRLRAVNNDRFSDIVVFYFQNLDT